MKKLSLILLLFATLTGWAQDLQFSFGPALIKDPRTGLSQTFFDTNQKKAYVLSGYTKLQVQSLDGYTNPKGIANLGAPFVDADQRVTILGAVTTDKIKVVYSTTNRKQRIQTVFAQEMNRDMKAVGSPVKLATFTNVKEEILLDGMGESFDIRPSVLFTKSADQQMLVLLKERDEKIELKGISLDKGELWSKDFTLSDDRYVLRSLRVSNSGNVYVLGSYYRKDEYRNPFVVAYAPNGNVSKIHTITTGEKIEDVGYNLSFLSDETPILAGLYNKKQKREAGYQVFRINPLTMELSAIATTPLSASYNKLIYKQAYEPEYFSVQQMLQLPNGNFVLSIEGGLVKNMKYTASVYFSSAYVVCLDSQGKELWNSTIEKHQVQSTGSDLVGHRLFNKGNQVFLIYNDNPDNYALQPTEMPKENLLKNKSYVAVIKFDENGKPSKSTPLNQTPKQVTAIFPSDINRIERDTIHFVIKRGDKFHFATLSLSEN